MLAVAMCHVLCILSLSVCSVNALSVYVGFMQTGESVYFDLHVKV